MRVLSVSSLAQHDLPPVSESITPWHYVMLPRPLVTSRLPALAIGLFAQIARIWMLTKAPVVLSITTVQRFDPSLATPTGKRQIKYALGLLCARGWLQKEKRGRTCAYTPCWGLSRRHAAPVSWNAAAPVYGRPRHCMTLPLPIGLLDVGIGTLVIGPYQNGDVLRPFTEPLLTLQDIGNYARFHFVTSDPPPAEEQLRTLRRWKLTAPEHPRDTQSLLAHFAAGTDDGWQTQFRTVIPYPAPALTQGDGNPRALNRDTNRDNVVRHETQGASASQCDEAPQSASSEMSSWNHDTHSRKERKNGSQVEFANEPEPPTAPAPAAESDITQHATYRYLIDQGVYASCATELASVTLETVMQAATLAKSAKGVRSTAGFLVYSLRRYRTHQRFPATTSLDCSNATSGNHSTKRSRSSGHREQSAVSSILLATHPDLFTRDIMKKEEILQSDPPVSKGTPQAIPERTPAVFSDQTVNKPLDLEEIHLALLSKLPGRIRPLFQRTMLVVETGRLELRCATAADARALDAYRQPFQRELQALGVALTFVILTLSATPTVRPSVEKADQADPTRDFQQPPMPPARVIASTQRASV